MFWFPTETRTRSARAAPNADVIVRDGTREVGRAKADARGEWVVIPKKPLPKGSRELTLSAKSKKGKTMQSRRNVVVLVPDRNKNTVGGGKRSDGALAVLVPRDGKGESIVIQRPGDKVAEMRVSKPDGTASRAVVAKAKNVPLSIDAVDYDEAGQVTISGRATPNARLHVYLENRFAGAGKADRLGRWRLVPGSTLSPGLYTFRVDQVGAEGNVVGRVETRFARSKPAGAVPLNAVVFVEPGNSLWRIARRVYGKGIRYSVIFAANREQIRNPDLIYPGQVFFVPHVN